MKSALASFLIFVFASSARAQLQGEINLTDARALSALQVLHQATTDFSEQAAGKVLTITGVGAVGMGVHMGLRLVLVGGVVAAAIGASLIALAPVPANAGDLEEYFLSPDGFAEFLKIPIEGQMSILKVSPKLSAVVIGIAENLKAP